MSSTALDKIIERDALGRSASLNALYDAREDRFCRGGLFNSKSELFRDAIETQNSPNSLITYVYEDNFQSKFSSLNISGELQMSILAGFVPLEGSGQFLKSNNSSSHSVRASLICSITTENEQLDVFSLAGKPDAINMNALCHAGATHVVTNIKWGAKVVLEVEYAKTDQEDSSKAKGKLKAFVEKIGKHIGETKGSVEGGSGQGFEDVGNKFSFKFYGDVVLERDTPKTVEQALNAMNGVRALIHKTNGGKGVPLKYELFPLSRLEKLVNLMDFPIPKLMLRIEEGTLKVIVQKFDNIDMTRRELQSHHDNAMSVHRYIPSEWVTSVDELKTNFDMERIRLDDKVKDALSRIRNTVVGEGQEQKDDHGAYKTIIDALDKYNGSPNSDVKVRKRLDEEDEMRKIRDCVQILHLLQQRNVDLLERGATLTTLIMAKNRLPTFVLLYDTVGVGRSVVPDEHFSYFVELIDGDAKVKKFNFVFANLGIHPELKTKYSKNTILRYEGGKLVSENALDQKVEQKKAVDNQFNDVTKRLTEQETRMKKLELAVPKEADKKKQDEQNTSVTKSLTDYGTRIAKLELVIPKEADKKKQEDQNTSVTKSIADFTTRLRKLEQYLPRESGACRLSDYPQKLADAQSGKDNGIWTWKKYLGKYKFRIEINLLGTGESAGKAISIFFATAPGIYDDELDWPFSKRITISVRDQNPDATKAQNDVTSFTTTGCTTGAFDRRTEEPTTSIAWGILALVTLEKLKTRHFVHNKDIVFDVNI